MAIEYHEWPPGYHCSVCGHEVSDEEVKQDFCGYCEWQEELDQDEH